MRSEHPRDFGLMDALASNGEPIVPVVSSRLQCEQDEAVQLYLIQVLGRMSSGGHFDVKSDRATLRLVESRIESMKDPIIRSMAIASLEKIRGELP